MARAEPFFIKRNDLVKSIEATLVDRDGNPVSLDEAESVRFLMRDAERQSKKVDAAATFVDRPTARVRYDWISGDTNTAGNFEGEFEVSWPTGKPQTFPNNSFIPITITADVA